MIADCGELLFILQPNLNSEKCPTILILTWCTDNLVKGGMSLKML